MEYGFKVKTVYIPSWECSQEVFTFYLPQNTPSKAAPLLTLSYLVQQEKNPSFFRSLCHTPSGSQWLMAASSKNKQLKLRHRGKKKAICFLLLSGEVQATCIPSKTHQQCPTGTAPHCTCGDVPPSCNSITKSHWKRHLSSPALGATKPCCSLGKVRHRYGVK